MDGLSPRLHGSLPRLAPEAYGGRAFIHWTMTIDRRATGWLDPLHHAHLREQLCHALCRHRAVCPVYCLMPDHGHFLLCGTTDTSNQTLAIRLLRREWNRLLAPARKLQPKAHDHLLREDERTHDAFQRIAWYIAENPVRAGLVSEWRSWPYVGCMVPGTPDLDPRAPDYWEHFWRVWNRLSESAD